MHAQLDDNFIRMLKVSRGFLGIFIANGIIIHLQLGLQLALSAAQIGQFTGLALLLLGLTMIIVGVIVSKKHKWYKQWNGEKVDDMQVLKSTDS